MEKTENPRQSSSSEVYDPNNEVQELLQTLEKKRNWNGNWLCQYNGFWYPLRIIPTIMCFQKHFKAADTDIILATMPKSGTTWLKALTFSIINRYRYSIDQSPLLTSSPHALVPFLEENIFRNHENPDLNNIPSPRIFATHMHFQLLQNTIKESDCRVIYICRNPMDQFISLWYFLLESRVENGGMESQSISMDEALEMYLQGIHGYGPFWEHMLEYWNVHLKNPEKVLFLKYEDLKKDIASNVKKIGEFIGYPFSLEEEKQGLIEQISKLCSFNNLKNLEVNKVGINDSGFKNSSYFRKGENGDSANHFTPSMVERIEKLMEMKLKGSGLMFNTTFGTANCKD